MAWRFAPFVVNVDGDGTGKIRLKEQFTACARVAEILVGSLVSNFFGPVRRCLEGIFGAIPDFLSLV